MNNTKHTFRYQPNLVSSMIVWSWTLLILLLGIVVWLEILKFEWWFLLIGFVFIALCVAQIGLRKVSVDRNLIIFSTVLNRSWLVIPRDQLESLESVRGGIKVQIDGNSYQFLMLKKARQALLDLV